MVAEHADGHRTVVSHFNKAHKGRLARALVSSRAKPDDAAKVAAIARRAGMRVERDGNELTVSSTPSDFGVIRVVGDAAKAVGAQSPRDLHTFFMRHVACADASSVTSEPQRLE